MLPSYAKAQRPEVPTLYLFLRTFSVTWILILHFLFALPVATTTTILIASIWTSENAQSLNVGCIGLGMSSRQALEPTLIKRLTIGNACFV